MSEPRIVSEDQIDKVQLLRRVPLFAALDPEPLRALAAASRVGVFPEHDEIIAEGDELLEEEDGLYLIVDGTVEVRRGSTDGTDGRLLATLGPGDFFGEMALLDGHPRSASVFARSETQCLMLSRWDFHRHVRSNPDVALKMLAVLSQRLRTMIDAR